ncbi:pyrimidine-specific ribonucleoside hydrolase RihB-like protein, partial [Leptotrombidium deliense]
EKQNAVQTLNDLVRMYPKRITILCLAPLTNLAVAHLIDKQFFEFVKELYILGGNIDALGNVTPAAEFNFCFDPEAAHITLKNSQCPVTIIPWEICFYQSLPWDRYEAMISLKGDKASFFKRITQQLLEILGY